MVEFCDRFEEQVGELIVSRNVVGSCNKSVAEPSKETSHHAMGVCIHQRRDMNQMSPSGKDTDSMNSLAYWKMT